MCNLEIRNFENVIVQYINSVDLPIEVKRIVVKDILMQLELETNKVLQNEIKEREVSENGSD